MFSTSALRAPGVIQPAWAAETMMDELAYAANMDALAFRQAHTTHDGWRPRARQGREAVANWKPRVSASQLSNERFVTGRGIAIGGENHANDDVYAGAVAEVEVDRKTGKIVVKHLYGVQESGVIVNPASAENQLSGMLIRGASRTIFEQVTFSKQRVTGLDWVSYPILRFKEHPTVTTVQLGHRTRSPTSRCRRPASRAALPRRRRVARGVVPAGDRQRRLRRDGRAHAAGPAHAGQGTRKALAAAGRLYQG